MAKERQNESLGDSSVYDYKKITPDKSTKRHPTLREALALYHNDRQRLRADDMAEKFGIGDIPEDERMSSENIKSLEDATDLVGQFTSTGEVEPVEMSTKERQSAEPKYAKEDKPVVKEEQPEEGEQGWYNYLSNLERAEPESWDSTKGLSTIFDSEMADRGINQPSLRKAIADNPDAAIKNLINIRQKATAVEASTKNAKIKADASRANKDAELKLKAILEAAKRAQGVEVAELKAMGSMADNLSKRSGTFLQMGEEDLAGEYSRGADAVNKELLTRMLSKHQKVQQPTSKQGNIPYRKGTLEFDQARQLGLMGGNILDKVTK